MNPNSNSSLPVSVSRERGWQVCPAVCEAQIRSTVCSSRWQGYFCSQTMAWNVRCVLACVGWEQKSNWEAFRLQRVWGNDSVNEGLATQSTRTWAPVPRISVRRLAGTSHSAALVRGKVETGRSWGLPGQPVSTTKVGSDWGRHPDVSPPHKEGLASTLYTLMHVYTQHICIEHNRRRQTKGLQRLCPITPILSKYLKGITGCQLHEA